MAAFLGPILSAAASAGVSSLLSKKGTTQKTRRPEIPQFQRQLIDQVLSGLQGNGPFANLFQSDQNAFNTSISEPLTQQFQNQLAPAIQQKFISSGQQRGSPLDIALARGGLDVQSEINKLFLPFQENALGRQQNAINQLLGFNVPQEQTTTSITPTGAALQGVAQSGAIEDISKAIASLFNRQGKSQNKPVTNEFNDNYSSTSSYENQRLRRGY